MVRGREELVRVLGKDAEFVTIEEGEDAFDIRLKSIVAKDVSNRLHVIIRDELDGKYDSSRRGWIVRKPTTQPGKGIGVPKIDAHLAQIEAEEAEEEKVAGKVILVETDRIRPNRYNPNEMSDEEFSALQENMKKEGPHGTSPLEVRPLDASSWEIIDGFHRWKASRLLGWKKIRCIVREVDEDRAQEINYEKNRLRGHINPFKEAELFYSTWSKIKTQEAVAKKFGVSQPYVADRLSLRKVPDEVRGIIPRGINPSLLEILARIDDPSDQETLAKKIAEGCTVRDAEAFVKGLESGVVEEKAKEVVLKLIGGEEEKVPAAQVKGVKEVTVKRAGKASKLEYVIDLRDESGVPSGVEVTEQCGLELEKLGFPVERESVDLGEPEQPAYVPMRVSILRHSPADARRDAWYELSYVVEAPNLHLGSGHPFDVEQDWEKLIEEETQRIERENPGIKIRAEVANDYRQWPPEQTVENMPKGAPVVEQPTKKGPYWCSWCGSDRVVGEVHESIVYKGVMVCNLCGRSVEVIVKPKEEAKKEGEEKAKIPPVPFREAVKVSVSQAEIDVYRDLQKAFEEGRLKVRPFLNDDHSYCLTVKGAYPDIVLRDGRIPDILVHIDGEEVHEGHEEWDDEVVKAAERQDKLPMRFPYKGKLSDEKRLEIVEQIVQTVNDALENSSLSEVSSSERS